MRKHAKATKIEATEEYLHEKGVYPAELAADALIATGLIVTTEVAEVASEMVIMTGEVENAITVYTLHVKTRIKKLLRR